jgi:hypothetical protein
MVFFCLDCLGQSGDSAYTEFRNSFDVVPLKINTVENEMFPFIAGGKIYFSSSRRKTAGISYSDVNGNDRFYDIFSADKIDSITFSEPVLSKKWSTVFNDASLAFNGRGNSALVSSNQQGYDFVLRSPKEQRNLRLYYSEMKNGNWEDPEMIPFCTGPYSYCNGTFLNENTVVFSSDMHGGYGGMDLYMSEYKDGNWSTPKNLGKEVNSSGNELFPFINRSGTLYFSSERKDGLGGLDIYSIAMKDIDSSKPLHLEAPINSETDDFGIWTDSTGNTGYITSNRKKENQDDIFYFYKIFPVFEKEIIAKTKFCYTFFEESSTLAMDTTGLEYEWDFGGGIKRRGREVNHCFYKSGVYPVQLNVLDRSSGELMYNDLSYDFIVEEPKQLNILCNDTVIEGSGLLLNASTSLIAGYSIKKYYWAFDDGWYAMGAETRHKYFNTGSYNVKLGVLAINDSTGKEGTFYSVKRIYVKAKGKVTGLRIQKNLLLNYNDQKNNDQDINVNIGRFICILTGNEND